MQWRAVAWRRGQGYPRALSPHCNTGGHRVRPPHTAARLVLSRPPDRSHLGHHHAPAWPTHKPARRHGDANGRGHATARVPALHPSRPHADTHADAHAEARNSDARAADLDALANVTSRAHKSAMLSMLHSRDQQAVRRFVHLPESHLPHAAGVRVLLCIRPDARRGDLRGRPDRGAGRVAMPIRDPRSLEEANRDDRSEEVGRLRREGEELEGEMVVAEAWGVVVRMQLTRAEH